MIHTDSSYLIDLLREQARGKGGKARRFAPVYGDALVTLQRAGRTVDAMDLLIATSAVVDGAALVTANRRHFDVIPGLEVFGY